MTRSGNERSHGVLIILANLSGIAGLAEYYIQHERSHLEDDFSMFPGVPEDRLAASGFCKIGTGWFSVTASIERIKCRCHPVFAVK
jgi:hypothetical protein